MNNKKKIFKIIIICFIILLTFTSFYMYLDYKLFNKTDVNDLINIDELSEEFVDNYFEEVNDLMARSSSSHILIVESLNKINEHGAINVINGPNNKYILEYKTKEDMNIALSKFKEDDSIYSVGENIQYTIDETIDATYNSWGIESMNLDYAIEVANDMELNNLNVAVLDTGLVMNTFYNSFPSSKIAFTYNSYGADNTDDEDVFNNMYDNNGHGTHVIGTVAEGTPDNVKVIPFKVGDARYLDDIGIVAAIDYITLNESAEVINMSFGTYDYSSSFKTSITAAVNKNIICVAAAGNDNTNQKHYPSDFDNVISIGSVDNDFVKSSFSNYGDYLDFVAPGSNIKSINGYKSGTSMATPHAVSAVAILKSFNKDLTFDEVYNLLKNNATDIGTIGLDRYYGHGFINFDNIKFCDGFNCDQYNVFKANGEDSYIKMEVSNPKLTTYDYVSLNNIMATEVKLYKTGTTYDIKKLSELDGVNITGYNPLSYTRQTVTIKYGNFKTSFSITNSGFASSGWEYKKLSNDTIEIIKYKDNRYNFNTLYFPEYINGYKVVSIAGSSDLISKVFGDSVDFLSFKKVVLSKYITSIGKSAFANSNNLVEVNVLSNNISLGDYAFNNNSSLTNFNGNISGLGIYTFAGCSLLNNIILLDTVEDIPNYAFNDCTSLQNINFPTNLKNIGDNAFAFSKVNDINIPNVVSVGNNAFYSCNYMEDVIFGKNLNSIGENAFAKVLTGASYEDDYVLNFKLYSNTVARDYARNNEIDYASFNYSYIVVSMNKSVFSTFDTVQKSYINNLKFYYDYALHVGEDYVEYLNESGNYEIFTGDFDISYEGESLVAEYPYFYVSGINSRGEEFRNKTSVTVNKIDPTYDIPDDLYSILGGKLSDVILPDGFEWVDGNVYLNDLGTNAYKAIYIPDDLNNYNTISDISINVEVIETKKVIVPQLKIKDKVYNGNNDLELNSIYIENLYTRSYSVVNVETSNVDVGKANAIVKVKLTEPSYNTYYFGDYKQEEEYQVNYNIIKNKISKPTIDKTEYTYNGLEQQFNIIDFNSEYMNVSGNIGTNVGDYQIVISLKNSNYLWDDGTDDDLIFNVKIIKGDALFIDDTKNKSINYNGLNHTIDISFDTELTYNIKYMDSNGEYNLSDIPKYSRVGVYTIKYKVIFNNNYNDYYGEKILTINQGVITNNTTDYIGYYDGNEHSLKIKLGISNYTIKYSTDNRNFTTTNPKFKKVGSYTVYYKINSDGYKEYSGANKVYIYGIKSFGSNVEVNGNTLILKSNSFGYLTNNINIYSNKTAFKHYDNNMSNVQNDVLKTGDRISIILNNNKTYTYKVSVLGDVNGNGKIDIIDYIRIMKHIMGDTKLSGEYYLASDMNENDKIDIIDYIRIMKIIMEEN